MDLSSLSLLAEAALPPTFGFLFGRLSHVLDSRKNPNLQDTYEDSAVLAKPLELSQIDQDAVKAHDDELSLLHGRLSFYDRSPEFLSLKDQDLLNNLDQVRSLLEKIYGQEISFHGEDRSDIPRVAQKDNAVSGGDLVGIKGTQSSGGHVLQEHNKVTSGSIIGLQF